MNRGRRTAAGSLRGIWIHSFVGMILGVLVLHPVTMVIYWFEFHPQTGESSLWRFAEARLLGAFDLPMLAMTAVFALLGAGLGLGAGLYSRALARRESLLVRLEEELGRDVVSLIQGGESERLELKASARWDHRAREGSRALEEAVVKTIAGFLNHSGGTLLIGVCDDGSILGLEKDYHTLKRKDRDGFEQFLTGLVKRRLGGEVCSMIHTVFHRLEDREICRVVVEASPRPVFVEGADRARYFLRLGNSTRELDTREAMEHIAGRW